MSPHKAPCEDDFPTLFYQHCWDIVAPYLHHFVSRIPSQPFLIGSANNTFVLIPRTDQLEFLTQFHLIALCNVIYKFVFKIMVNRVKHVLNNIILPYYFSFILGGTSIMILLLHKRWSMQ